MSDGGFQMVDPLNEVISKSCLSLFESCRSFQTMVDVVENLTCLRFSRWLPLSESFQWFDKRLSAFSSDCDYHLFFSFFCMDFQELVEFKDCTRRKMLCQNQEKSRMKVALFIMVCEKCVVCQRCNQTETENRMNWKALWVKCLTVNLIKTKLSF